MWLKFVNFCSLIQAVACAIYIINNINKVVSNVIKNIVSKKK